MRRRLAVVAIVILVSGCATVDPREDLRIEAEVKARLVAEKNANLTRLGVVSSDGTVYLTGNVESPDEGVRAETLAGGVRGVKRVVNTLDVTSSPKERPTR